MLSEAGYHVLECDNAEAALELSTRRKIFGVVTDERLAGSLSGSQLVTALMESAPFLRFVLISGEPPLCELPPSIVFLQKPFLADALLAALR
jgi:DNA-binding NtrC family response regulator